jgi:undecaprenyl-diphosphatase
VSTLDIHPAWPATRPRFSARFWIIFALAALVLLAITIPLDRSAHAWFAELRAGAIAKHKPWEIRDWYQALRQLGFLPVWLITGACLMAIDSAATLRAWWHRGTLVIASVISAGAAAEACKLIVGRIKPEDSLGDPFQFWPWADRFAKLSDTGFVSSHSAVSMAAACAIGYLFPRTRWLIIPCAVGTSLTRLLVGGHYLSDTIGGMLLGLLAARVMASILARKHSP